MIKIARIVCPTDFSPTSSRAVDYAAAMADSFGAELILLHVIPEMTYPLRSFGMASSFPHLRQELQTRAREALERIVEGVKAMLPGLQIRIELRDGEAHEVVLECAAADHADMVVMGTHGYTGIKHAFLGSTAEKVVRMAKCPVLTVRA